MEPSHEKEGGDSTDNMAIDEDADILVVLLLVLLIVEVVVRIVFSSLWTELVLSTTMTGVVSLTCEALDVSGAGSRMGRHDCFTVT
jgi:hypothetical protein